MYREKLPLIFGNLRKSANLSAADLADAGCSNLHRVLAAEGRALSRASRSKLIFSAIVRDTFFKAECIVAVDHGRTKEFGASTYVLLLSRSSAIDGNHDRTFELLRALIFAVRLQFSERWLGRHAFRDSRSHLEAF